MEKEYYTQGAMKASSQTIEPASPFDRLAAAVERLHELRKMSGMLADRLAGPVPPGAAEANLDALGLGGGLLDRQTAVIKDLSREIADNLQRIESRL